MENQREIRNNETRVIPKIVLSARLHKRINAERKKNGRRVVDSSNVANVLWYDAMTTSNATGNEMELANEALQDDLYFNARHSQKKNAKAKRKAKMNLELETVDGGKAQMLFGMLDPFLDELKLIRKQFEKSADKCEKAADDIAWSAKTATEMAEDIAGSIKTASESTGKAAEEISSTTKSLREKIEDAADTAKSVFDVAVISRTMTQVVCKLVLYAKGPKDLTASIALLTDILLTWPSVVSKIVNFGFKITEWATHFYNWVTESEKTEENKAEADWTSATLTGLLSMVSTVLFIFMFGNNPSESTLTQILKTVVQFGAISRAVKFSIEGLQTLFTASYNAIYRWKFGVDPVPSQLGELGRKLDEFFRETEAVRLEYTVQKMRTDGDYRQRVMDTYAKGLSLTRDVSSVRPPPAVVSSYNTSLRVITDLVAKRDANGPVDVEHSEPLVVYLYGESAVGKSTITPLLAKALLKQTLGYDFQGDGIELMYNRNIEQDFWDGYKQQPICIYDDFAQIRDSTTNGNLEFMEIIRTANTSPMYLHMADLSDKASSPFMSKIILISSNQKRPQVKSITTPMALYRRFDIAFEVTRNPDYNRAQGIHPNFCQFQEYDPKQEGDDNYMGDVQNWKTTFAQIGQKYIEKFRQGKSRSEAFEMMDSISFMPSLKQELQEEEDELDAFMRETEEDDVMVNTGPEYTEDELLRQMLAKVMVHHEQTPNSPPVVVQDIGSETSSVPGDTERELDEDEIFVDANNDQGCNRSNVAQGRTYERHNLVINKHATVTEALKAISDILDKSPRLTTKRANWRQPKMGLLEKVKFFNKEMSETDLVDWKAATEVMCDFGYFRNNPCVDMYREVPWSFAYLPSTVEPWNITPKGVALFRIIDYNLRLPEAPEWAKRFKTGLKIYHTLCVTEDIPEGHLTLSEMNKKIMDQWDLTARLYPNTMMIGYIIFAYGLWRLMKSLWKTYARAEGASEEVLSHAHEGLTIGKKVKHSHACEDCEKIFSHTHEIRLEALSRRYGAHLCKECRRKKPDLKDMNKIEMASSGDPSTLRHTTKAEMVSSGDPRTGGSRCTAEQEVSTRDITAVTTSTSLLDKVAEMMSSGDASTASRPIKAEASEEKSLVDTLLSKIRGEETTTVKAEGADMNLMQVRQVVARNVVSITFKKYKPDGGIKMAKCMGIFLKGRVVLTVAHSVIVGMNYDEAVVENVFTGNTWRINPVSRLHSVQVMRNKAEVDLALVRMPVQVPEHASIMSYFPTKEEVKNFSSFEGLLVSEPGSLGMTRHGEVESVDKILKYVDDLTGRLIKSRHFFQYQMQTTSGDCGMPLFAVGKQFPRKLVGIHVAGNDDGYGFSTPTIKEELEAAMEDLPQSAQVALEIHPLVNRDVGDDLPEGQFQPIGSTEHAPGVATKTKLRPSLIHGMVTEPTTEPAPLTEIEIDGERQHPMDIGLKKAGVPCVFLDEDKVEAAARDVTNILKRKKTTARVLTDREMVAGIEGETYAPSIKRSTSAGWPYVLVTKHGKKELISEDFEVTEELLGHVKDREQRALRGLRTPTTWVDTLKDERRPFEKTKKGKTRVFSCGPVDFTLLFRKYFLGFASDVAKHRIRNEIAVGTNPFSMDWEVLVNHVTKHGDNMIAGDFSNYDGTLQIEILERMVHIINDWYDDGPANAMVRKMLWREIVNSTHIRTRSNGTSAVVYGWTHSQPSGCPITSVLNSIYNSLSVRYVWLDLAQKYDKKKANMISFHANVSMVSYGDDNLIGVSEDTPWFNQKNMSEAYSRMGMTYTDEDKKGPSEDFRRLKEVSFIKRGFRWEPVVGRHIAPLAQSTIFEMCNWIRGDLNKSEATGDNVANAIFEASLHGPEFYEYWSQEYLAACMEKGVRLVVPTWLEMIESRFLAAAEADVDFSF